MMYKQPGTSTIRARSCFSVPLILLLWHFLGVARSLPTIRRKTIAGYIPLQHHSSRRYGTCKPYVSSVLEWLDFEDISWRSVATENIPLQYRSAHSTKIELLDSSILLHLIPTPTSLQTSLSPTLNKKLTEWVSQPSQEAYSKIIHLHEDIWLAKNEIAKARLLVQSLKRPQRIFARKTTARRLNATEARSFLAGNHLWGATKAKHHYGLYRGKPPGEGAARRRRRRRKCAGRKEEELVAVATFSRCRKVRRNDRPFNSYELLRYCSLKDSTVVGGISKLLKAFERDVNPDDVVTMVDRDWGEASGWRTDQLGFETMTVLDPLVMAVSPSDPGVRRYLVGAGLEAGERPGEASSKRWQRGLLGRMGLPPRTREALEDMSNSDAKGALQRLADDDLYPVYDAGVERLYKVLSSNNTDHKEESAKVLWQTAQPKYVHRYYSSNAGIVSLLEYAAVGSPPLDGPLDREAIDSWRATSSTAASATVIYSVPSSMDPDAVIEIRRRADGWRTMGIVGSRKGVSSIYHGIFRVDESTVRVVPGVVVSDYIKTMAVLSLAGQACFNDRSGRDDDPLRFLHFGYGAGMLARFLAHHVESSDHVAVELDRGVVDAARQLKPDLPNVSVVVRDALKYAQEYHSNNPRGQRFDCICIDVFDENNLVPEQFYSTRFLQTLSDHLLTPRGIIVQNFHSGGRRRRLVVETASKAFGEVFADVCWVPSIDSNKFGGNSLVMASKVPIPEDGDGNVALSRNSMAVQTKFGLSFDAVARVQSVKRTL